MNLPSFFNSNQHIVVSPWFSVNYWIGIIFPLVIITSLFVFKKFYAKLINNNYFRYFLGFLQLFLFFLYYLFHYFSHDFTWQEYFPFQLCSILDLTSAAILLFPSEKLFTITFPLTAPVVLVFLVPPISQTCYGLNNFFYYQYYFHHTIIIFSYLFFYLYGGLKYNSAYLKQSIYAITIFGIVIFIFDNYFNTNYLYIGQAGYSAAIGSIVFNTGLWAPILRFIFMFFVGIIFIMFFHFVIAKLIHPFKLNTNQVNNYSIYNKQNFKKNILRLKYKK